MPRALSRKAAIVCGAVATTAVFGWRYQPSPVAFSKETPTLAPGVDAIFSGQLWECMRFLDQRRGEWKVESSNFLKEGGVSRPDDDPKVQVLRLGSSYPTDAKNGRPAPFMRIVGFFPDVLPEEVFEFMTDLHLRRQWDRNYHMFCKWNDNDNKDSAESGAVNHLETTERPIEMVAKKTPLCQGDSCLLAPDVARDTVDQGWFAHRVGHSLLDKFGIADRLFVYQRRSVSYTKRDHGPKPLKMYDVLYSGTDEAVEMTREQSKSFHKWLYLCEKEREAARVSVNYQHILILPIADAASQLWANPLPLSCGGSMVDGETTKIVYDTFINSVRLQKETNKLDGTLMIMTSANDVQIPRSVPMWAQRMLAAFFSNHAYREMLKAIRSHRIQVSQ